MPNTPQTPPQDPPKTPEARWPDPVLLDRTLTDLSRSTRAWKRANAVAFDLSERLGGWDGLSRYQRRNVAHAAVRRALADIAHERLLQNDETVTFEDVVRLANSADRAEAKLGIKANAEPAGPELAEYLAENYGAKA